MFLLLIDALRYMINGLFAFYNLSKYRKCSLLKVIALSTIYALVLTTFKLLIIDSPAIVIVSAIVIFIILIIENKLENFKFSLIYSTFIACLTEYIHFFIFKSVSKTIELLNMEEIHHEQPEKLFIGRAIILMLYVAAIFFTHKFKKVNIDFIKKLSNYKTFPIFLIIALFVITYLKYHIKYTKSNDFHYTLSFILALFITISFVFLFSSKTFLDKIETLSKKNVNLAIEESKLKKKRGFPGLLFNSEKLNSEMNKFLKMLEEIGMDTEDKKSKQIAYCAVLLNHEENPQNVNMISVIYPHVADILDRQPKTIESNISNAIKNLWNSHYSEIVEKINKNYKKEVSSEDGCPKTKEFLLYLVEEYRSKYNKD